MLYQYFLWRQIFYILLYKTGSGRPQTLEWGSSDASNVMTREFQHIGALKVNMFYQIGDL